MVFLGKGLAPLRRSWPMIRLKDSLAIEDNPHVLDFRFSFRDVLMWPYIRVFLHRIPIFREFRVTPLAHDARAPLGLGGNLAYLYRTLVRNPFRKAFRNPCDVLMLCWGINNVKTGSAYFNKITDFFASLHGDRAFLVETTLDRRYRMPRAHPRVAYGNYIELATHLRSRLVRVPSQDRETVRALSSFLQSDFPFKIEAAQIDNMMQDLLGIAARLPIYYDYYQRLFDQCRPRAALIEDACYGAGCHIVKWARERCIPTIEPQHGMIYPDHMAYNYGRALLESDLYRQFLPDYLLTYGSFWSDQVNVPVAKLALGNPNRSEKCKRMPARPKGGERWVLLIISAGSIPETMRNFLLNLIETPGIGQCEIIFRPHPLEVPLVNARYAQALASEAIRLDVGTDLYQSLARADFVAGDLSTTLFEAMGIVREVFCIEHPSSDLAIPRDLMKRFSSASELLRLIREHRPQNQSAHDDLWAPNWEANYRQFMKIALRIEI
jgi:hypothetical protein